MNKVQTTADFMIDAAIDLLTHAELLEKGTPGKEITTATVPLDRKRKLITTAAHRKKRRLLFFNSTDGVELRLSVTNHVPNQGRSAMYCALCGQNGNREGTGWRGHRTTYSCTLCSVPLCVRVYPGLRKSCWSLWHSQKELKPRQTPSQSKQHNVTSEQT